MMWYEDKNNDIVVSTRIRLARNLKDTPFPMFMTAEQKKQSADKLQSAIVDGNSTIASSFEIFNMDDMSDMDKQAMCEEHLISDELTKRNGARALISKDKTMSIMLMEEDHIRLQIIMSGYKLDEAYSLADKVDDVIEENAEYAFDKDFGYLTSCPTNVGTGLRASVMVHLPALAMTNNLERVLNSAANLGIAVRGLYGESSKTVGDLYQLSNQVTLGASEQDIIAKLKNITDQIIEYEKQARKTLAEKHKDIIEDRVWRAYGTLKYARKISSDEAKTLFSNVMLGINMGIINADINVIKMMIMSEPANVAKSAGKLIDADERDKKRAEMIRKMLD